MERQHGDAEDGAQSGRRGRAGSRPRNAAADGDRRSDAEEVEEEVAPGAGRSGAPEEDIPKRVGEEVAEAEAAVESAGNPFA